MRMSDALLLMTTPVITDLNDPIEQLFRATSEEACLGMMRFLTSDEAVELLDNMDLLDTEEAKRSALFDEYILYLEGLLDRGA